jgi:predicted nuclease of restriction endonuclease-like (RecB) superfamily
MTKKPERTGAKKPGKASGKKRVSSPTRQAPASQKAFSPSRRAGPIAFVGKDDELTALLERIVDILEQARARVVRAVNSEMVLAYWHIGREIVEHQQGGDVRAGYGKKLIEELSERLGNRFGRGFSTTNLRYFRTFYLAYSTRRHEIRHIRSGESLPMPLTPDSTGATKTRHIQGGVLDDLERATSKDGLNGFSPLLGWAHYRALMKVEHEAARRFYEIEAEREGWSVEHLERQIHTQLFGRLLKSRDKAGVMDLASRGQVLERPIDAMKHPYVLDFLDLPESHQLRERDLETAILDKLQRFLLELGKGFAFIARQKRLSFEDEHFYVDLVFYNVILKCYLLVDLKLGKLTHQDVGQMDSYVRLFDDQCRGMDDNPTIGLILCAERNEAIARYSILEGHEQLFAAKYVTYLPSEEELQREIARERRSYELGPPRRAT